MVAPTNCEKLLKDNPDFEALLLCSRDGLPIAVHTRTDGATDEMVSIAANLVFAAENAGFLSAGKVEILFIEAAHGGCWVRSLDDGTLFVVLVCGPVTIQEIDAVLAQHEQKCRL